MRRRAMLLAVGVAVAVVGVTLGATSGEAWFAASLFARDNAMSHGASNAPGALDGGDLANYVRQPARGDVQTHAEARLAGGRAVGGDWGDIIALRPNGASSFDAGGQPVLRRALVWVDYNATSGRFDAPALGQWSVASLTIPQVGSTDPARGWVVEDLAVPLVEQGPSGPVYPAGQRSGWITKADHQAHADQHAAEGRGASQVVDPAWVEARIVRVVDADAMVVPMAAGIAGAVAVGAVGLVFRDRIRGIAGKGRRAVASVARAACACGHPWEALAFCARCGLERAPANRYTPEALHAARAARATRRR